MAGSGLHWACITHCTTICAILTIDDLEKKGGVSMQILPLASHRYYGARQQQAVDVFPRGDSEVLPTLSMGKWTECMCEALLRRPPSKPFNALEHLFLLCRGCSAFWPARFSTSSLPIVIFRLISFRLVLHDRFFFSSLSSLFFCSVFQGTPSHSSCTTWQSLQKYQHQSVGKRWNESPFSLPAEQLAHPNMYTQEVLI